jgi:hypothetical protein
MSDVLKTPIQQEAERQLDFVLAAIMINDENYSIRYPLVFQAVHLALELGYSAGIRIDANEPTWPVAYIELPNGQVSWHMPQHEVCWDGHTTADKYDRIREFLYE